MYLGKTESNFDVNVNLKSRCNANNLLLCLGDSGNGKTTLLSNLARDANQEGIPVIIPDTSESYLKSRIKNMQNLCYFNIITDGFPIDIFKPKIVKYDDVEDLESGNKIASRITNILLQAFNIKGAVQTSVLATAVKNYVCGPSQDKTLAGIVSELKKMTEPQAKVLACRLKALSDVPPSEELINWSDIVNNNKIAVFQLSFLDNPLRNFFLELILSDFWDWARKSGNRKDVLLVLDELSNFSFAPPYFMSQLREFRKFGIAAVMATQFLGGLRGKEAVNLLNQAAIRTYFGIRDTKEVARVAKEIDYSNYKKWMPIISELNCGECVFCGKIFYQGTPIEQKAVIKVPYTE